VIGVSILVAIVGTASLGWVDPFSERAATGIHVLFSIIAAGALGAGLAPCADALFATGLC